MQMKKTPTLSVTAATGAAGALMGALATAVARESVGAGTVLLIAVAVTVLVVHGRRGVLVALRARTLKQREDDVPVARAVLEILVLSVTVMLVASAAVIVAIQAVVSGYSAGATAGAGMAVLALLAGHRFVYSESTYEQALSARVTPA